MAQQKQRWNRRRGNTIFRRMLAFLLTVLLAQMLIYVAVLFAGGILDEMENNAFYILSERTANRKLDLENEMIQRWSNVEEGKSDIMAAVADTLEKHGATITALRTSQNLCQEILAATADSLVSTLRRNGVTGSFAILDCTGIDDGYPGVYIRDYDPLNYSSDNADLLLERGLPEVARSLSIPMDSCWSARFRFAQQPEGSNEIFFPPMVAARSTGAENRQENYFYHWSGQITLSEADRPVMAYTVPLVWEDGTVIGVLGVDLTIDYLAEQLKYEELGENRSGAYFLGVSKDGGNTYTTVCTAGPNFRAYFGQPETLTVTADTHAGIVTLPDNHSGRQIYGALQPLKLYNNNTPFEKEQWALIGILSGEHLLQISDRVHGILMISMVMSFLLGLAIIFMAARSFTRPISELMDDLRKSDPDKPIHLRRIKINELDALSESIEDLSNAAAESASRVSKIVAMSHIPIGVFEYHKKGDKVFCSKRLFEILNWPERPEEDLYLPEEEFLRRLRKITAQNAEGRKNEQVFHLLSGGRDHWVQLFYREENENALGVFLEVTSEVESKQKIEYERDYDILTDLFNRRAFDQRMIQLFDQHKECPLSEAALLMLDLDNLKYTNDTYGHDYGDRYIQAFAHCLEFFYTHRAVVGRRSGDEFSVFLYGYESRNEVRRITNEFWALLGETYITLPGGTRIRVRASGGIAWYGSDADDYTELLRLSDFAMYNVKHTVKGELREFDQADYAQKSILIQGQDALNRTLESHMIRYALQPIVSAVDGSIYGYEFLMRPMLEQLSDLKALFRLAKAQSKLQQIEEMTWVEAMDRFARLDAAGKLQKGTRAFINSVGNQYLSDTVVEYLEENYKDLLNRVVIEITESEEASGEISAAKKARIAVWGGLLALDDYGTGYNGESALVRIIPDIVKLDLEIVHEIDSDSDKLALVSNLVAYAKSRHIMILAEGVETRKELETLIACGVDLVQGFYLGRPEFDIPVIPPEIVEEIRDLHKQYFP